MLICSSIRFIEHESAFVWLKNALKIIAPILLLETLFCGQATQRIRFSKKIASTAHVIDIMCK